MCDSEIISRLYVSVLHEDLLKYNISSADIRTGIQNMKEVYKPNPMSLTSASLDVANYNDVAHRCAYLHKYAPFHTALVAEMLSRAIHENSKVFRDILLKGERFNICSLGGGPGSDVIGVLSVMNAFFGFFQVSATIIDCMEDWGKTFASVIKELCYGEYGHLGDCVSDQYFEWSYIGSNLLGKMSNQVNKSISTANLVTMIKFVSAAACKDTPAMIKKIFRTMKPGALVLYIDNAGGGFHQLVRKEAQDCNLITVFGPLKHEHYATNSFNVKRFGYTPCLETKVSVHVWRKPSQNRPSNLNFTEQSIRQNEVNIPIQNMNQQPIVVPGRATSFGGVSGVFGDSWNNFVNKNFQGIHVPPVNERRRDVMYSHSTYSTEGVSSNVSNRYVMDTTRTGPPRHTPRRPTSNKTVQQQPWSNSPRRPASGSEYRPAPVDDIPDNDDPTCCGCVIS